MRLVEALGSLGTVPAPEELEERVAGGLEPGSAGLRAAAHLGLLEPRGAPAELDGLVVAALHAGYRQDRAAANLRRRLGGRLAAPADLERRLAASGGDARPNPGDLSQAEARTLKQGVAEDLTDLPRALSGRMAGKLSRREAPEELADGISGPFPRRDRRWTLGLAAALCAATLVAAWGGGGWWLEGASPEGAGPTVLSFEVRRLESAAELEHVGLASALDNSLLTAARSNPQAAFGPRPSSRRAAGAGAASGGQAPNRGAGGLPAAPGASNLSPADLPLLAALQGAFERVEYRGERRVFLSNPALTTAPSIEYREEVGSDGLGAFFVRPLEVLSPPLDPTALDLFLMLQEERQGFMFRYRDFRIGDLELFMERYQVAVRPQEEEIAGRTCQILEVSRRENAERDYVLAVDPKTGLLLRYEETFQSGEPVARVEFESLELDPDFSDGALTGGPSTWVPFDPDQALPSQVNFDPLRPKLPPEGFQLAHASSRMVMGQAWLRFVYHDGVDQVLFLHDGPETSGGPLPGTDTVSVFTLGAWTVVEGEIGGHTLFVMGKVDEQDLLGMVQSAVE
ncbi:MAG: sigma-E factor regulatory protein RseB domain-containing protein [Planctomycetota bacterium]|nr:sigma-E factor regulatory protein RseB domain-containing protein [Planctomycetota bacterium]